MKFLFLVTLFALTACNTLHKTATTTTEKLDSVHVVKNTLIAISKSDSNSIKREVSNYERQTVYQYDRVYKVLKGDTVLQYVPRIVKVFEKGNFNKEETAIHVNYDSTVAHEIDSAMKQSEARVDTKEKSTNRASGLVVLVALGAFAMLLLFMYFKKK